MRKMKKIAGAVSMAAALSCACPKTEPKMAPMPVVKVEQPKADVEGKKAEANAKKLEAALNEENICIDHDGMIVGAVIVANVGSNVNLTSPYATNDKAVITGIYDNEVEMHFEVPVFKAPILRIRYGKTREELPVKVRFEKIDGEEYVKVVTGEPEKCGYTEMKRTVRGTMEEISDECKGAENILRCFQERANEILDGTNETVAEFIRVVENEQRIVIEQAFKDCKGSSNVQECVTKKLIEEY